eukprot:gene50475-67595_t
MSQTAPREYVDRSNDMMIDTDMDFGSEVEVQFK